MSADNENTIDYEILPYESWEKLEGETALAYGAFCAFRDYGPERNIKKNL